MGHPNGRRAWEQPETIKVMTSGEIGGEAIIQQRAVVRSQIHSKVFFKEYKCLPLKYLFSCFVGTTVRKNVSGSVCVALTSHKPPGHFCLLLKPELSICNESEERGGDQRRVTESIFCLLGPNASETDPTLH